MKYFITLSSFLIILINCHAQQASDLNVHIDSILATWETKISNPNYFNWTGSDTVCKYSITVDTYVVKKGELNLFSLKDLKKVDFFLTETYCDTTLTEVIEVVIETFDSEESTLRIDEKRLDELLKRDKKN